MKDQLLYGRADLQFRDCTFLDRLPHGWSDKRAVGSFSELWYVMGGEAYMRIDGKVYRLHEGDFCLHPDTLFSEYGCDRAENFSLWALRFEGALWSTSLFEWLQMPFVVHLPVEKRQAICEAFAALEDTCEKSISLSELMARKGRLFYVFSLYLQEAQATTYRREGRIGDVVQYIDTHLDEPLSVADVAAFIHVTPNYFAHYFRAETGMSPARYIADRKRSLAKSLLESGVSVRETARRVGFDDDAQGFARFFKRNTGKTPREYQEKFQRGKA